MDKLANKLMLVFVCLVVFDAMSFDVNFQKNKFGILGSLINTVNTTVSFVRAVR